MKENGNNISPEQQNEINEGSKAKDNNNSDQTKNADETKEKKSTNDTTESSKGDAMEGKATVPKVGS